VIEFYFEEVVENQLNEELITSWITKLVKSFHLSVGNITYIFCNDDYILDVNRKYLSHDYFTDVITFDYREGNIISGDIFISLDTVKSNSIQFHENYIDELHRVIIHGILHLIGFKDKSTKEEAVMRSEEDKALNLLKTIS